MAFVSTADYLEEDSSPTKSVTFDESASIFDSASLDDSDSLEEISAEIRSIYEAINRGDDYDEARLEYLCSAQLEHPVYQARLAEEFEQWRDSIDEFCTECMDAMRSFIPINIFSTTYESLVENDGLFPDVARRILQKQCLWLIRMSSAEIARMHEADFVSQYNITAQMLDIVEVTAIYASLPMEFMNDNSGKKLEWKRSIETTLKDMLKAKESGTLPKGKSRSPAYKDVKRGPYTDLSTVRYVEAIVASTGPRRSFTETCRQHSILSAFRKKDKKKKKKVVEDEDGDGFLKPAANES